VLSLDPAAAAAVQADAADDVRTSRRTVHCNDGSRQPDDAADLEDLLQHTCNYFTSLETQLLL